MGKFKIQKSATVNQYADATNVIGGTGGLTTITGTQVQATAYVTGGTAGNNASLLRARGRSKFFVADTSNTIQDENIVTGGTYVIKTVSNTDWKALGGPQSAVAGDIFTATTQNAALTTNGEVYRAQVCTLKNYLGAEQVAGDMNITMDKVAITSANLTKTVSGSTTFAYLTYANANATGVTTVSTFSDPTHLVLTGTGINGNVTITGITTGGGNSNANVSFSSQNMSNVVSGTVYISSYVSRLDNKFAHDFQNNKYAWTFNSPTSTTVRISGN